MYVEQVWMVPCALGIVCYSFYCFSSRRDFLIHFFPALYLLGMMLFPNNELLRDFVFGFGFLAAMLRLAHSESMRSKPQESQ
jgi:hypothetical protein